MIQVSDEQFEQLIGEALDSLPQEYVSRLLPEVAVTWAEDPTPEQRVELKLRHGDSLFGLYEGLPLSQRSGMTKFTPDKITIFKHPTEAYCNSLPELREQIRKTVWHEMAHFFGLDHKRIHELGG